MGQCGTICSFHNMPDSWLQRHGEKEYSRHLGPDVLSTKKNHGTQDSRVVPHRGTNWAALWLTAQIGRDAVLSEPYGRGCWTM